MSGKVKLAGGLEKTVTWVWLEDELLNVEYYDFSAAAQEAFGNDIAYTLTVIEMSKLLSVAGQNERSLMRWLTANFKSYYDLKQWLDEHGIAFRILRESHA